MMANKRIMTVFLLTVTFLYLLFELGFSARLLDASGGLADIDEIKHIEHWGRALSGIAAALFCWGFLLKRPWSYGKFAAALVALIAVWIPLMFAIQQHIVESAIERLDGGQRRDASFLVVATRFMLGGNLRVANLDLPEDAWNDPAGKAFIAVFPVLASSLPNLETEAKGILRATLRKHLTQGCTVGKNGCFGSFEEFNNEIWRPVIGEVSESFRKYSKGVNDYADAIDRIPAEQERAWRDYVRKLSEKRYTPTSVPARGWSRVRSEVRSMGVPVSDTWAPSDRAGFNAAVATAVRRSADDAYEKGMKANLGDVLPRTLTPAAFMRHPAIQSTIVEKMGVAELRVPLDYVVAPQDVMKRIYLPLITAATDHSFGIYTAAMHEFDVGGRHEELGRQAAERLIVPPLALVFSLIGGLGHLSKSIFLGTLLLSRRRGIAWAACLTALTLGLVGGYHYKNPVSVSPVYTDLESQVAANSAFYVPWALRWIVQTEPVSYPIAEAIRRHALVGLTYGYVPKELPKAAPASGEEAVTETVAVPPVGDDAVKLEAAAAVAPSACVSEFHAHRGVRPHAENTAAAIQAAGAAGFDAAEIDVQPLKDGYWAVHHDAVTGRAVVGVKKPASALTAEEWKQLRAVDARGKSVGAPSLMDEAIEAANAGHVRLHIEVKAPVSCRQIDNLIAMTRGLEKAPYWSTAFPSAARCLAARSVEHLGIVVGPQERGGKLSRGIEKGQEIGDRLGVDTSRLRKAADGAYEQVSNRSFLSQDGIAEAAGLAAGAKRRALHIPHTDLSPALIQRAKANGLTLAVYAGNGDEAGMADAIKRTGGFAPLFIITDERPEYFCPTKSAPSKASPSVRAQDVKAASSMPDMINGAAALLDTATLNVSGHTLPLAYVTAVPHQRAIETAQAFLKDSGDVSCRRAEGETYSCLLPRKNLDLAETLVLSGLAKAKPGAPDNIVKSEASARTNKTGIWSIQQ